MTASSTHDEQRARRTVSAMQHEHDGTPSSEPGWILGNGQTDDQRARRSTDDRPRPQIEHNGRRPPSASTKDDRRARARRTTAEREHKDERVTDERRRGSPAHRMPSGEHSEYDGWSAAMDGEQARAGKGERGRAFARPICTLLPTPVVYNVSNVIVDN
jgi:hypothetical protein